MKKNLKFFGMAQFLHRPNALGNHFLKSNDTVPVSLDLIGLFRKVTIIISSELSTSHISAPCAQDFRSIDSLSGVASRNRKYQNIGRTHRYTAQTRHTDRQTHRDRFKNNTNRNPLLGATVIIPRSSIARLPGFT